MTEAGGLLAQLARWRAGLVTVTLHALMFLSVSGYTLFFYGAFLDSGARLGLVHWTAGLVFAVPYALYQLRHYLRVRGYAERVHFKLGVATFVTVVVTILSGVPLIFTLPERALLIVDLVHVVAGFALLIVLCAHLVLVARVTLDRARRAAENGEPILSSIVMRVLTLPLLVSSVITALLLLG